MVSCHFSSQEVEILLQLSRTMGRGKRKKRLAATPLLEASNQLLASRWAMLSILHHDESAANEIAIRAIQVIPSIRPHTTARFERLIAQLLAERGIKSASIVGSRSDGIWTFDGLPDEPKRKAPRTGGPALLAEWATKSDGTRFIISVHRSREMPAFTARDIATMKLIRLACENTRPKAGVKMTRRLDQVLTALERGLTEKECAKELNLSRHTVHVYVKSLHKRFMAHSRGELLKLSNNRSLPAKPNS
jgi:DNA-binding CsgD family transcriptional regulator